MAKHYSVRKSVQEPTKFKIVIAGGWAGYEDIDLPLFDTIQEALSVVTQLNSLREQGIR